MKKFDFTLEKLLKFKEQVLDKEKGTLGQLLLRQNQLEAKIKSSEEHLAAQEQALLQLVTRGATMAEINLYRFQIYNLKEQIADLKRQLAELIPTVEEQRKLVIAASQEVSSLEKLKEKQLEEYNKHQQKAQEGLIAEFVTMSVFRERNNAD